MPSAPDSGQGPDPAGHLVNKHMKISNCLLPAIALLCALPVIAHAEMRLVSGQDVNEFITTKSWNYYSIDAQEHHDSLDVRLWGVTGDVDLYVRQDRLPTATDYDCSSTLRRLANESCVLTIDRPARWYIGVYGYNFGNYRVGATLTGNDPGDQSGY